MAIDIITHPEAEEEFDQALVYLDNQSLWAGQRLFAEYNDAVARILDAPGSFRIIYSEYRRFNLPNYPFHIIYRIRSTSVYVIAIAHDKRHPDYWKARIQDDFE